MIYNLNVNLIDRAAIEINMQVDKLKWKYRLIKYRFENRYLISHVNKEALAMFTINGIWFCIRECVCVHKIFCAIKHDD